VNGQILNVAELVLFGTTQPVWDAATVYDSGDRVSYGGVVYVAQWWTKGQVPGSTTTGSWMAQGALVPAAGEGVRTWTPSWVYQNGDVVELGGHTYRARWWTRGQQPGAANGPWQDLGAY
jgi:chitodextrinase